MTWRTCLLFIYFFIYLCRDSLALNSLTALDSKPFLEKVSVPVVETSVTQVSLNFFFCVVDVFSVVTCFTCDKKKLSVWCMSCVRLFVLFQTWCCVTLLLYFCSTRACLHVGRVHQCAWTVPLGTQIRNEISLRNWGDVWGWYSNVKINFDYCYIIPIPQPSFSG